MAFTIKASLEVFSQEEIEILDRHGEGFERLMAGELSVHTQARVHFLKVCRNEAEPENAYERAWRKYLDRLEWESDPENRFAMGARRRLDEGFGTREDHKNLRRAERAEFLRRLRE